MKNQTNFNNLYKKLNPQQRKAVDTIEGPVMVVAGPGTGKTQILTLRIANILRKTDVGANSILALTFTESAAYSMRRRLVDIIGSDAYKVNIYTFHGFANEIISKYPEEFERIVGSRNITEADQIGILKKILAENQFKLIRPYGDPNYYLRGAMDAIKELKREDISPEEFKILIEKEKKEFENIEDLYHAKGQHKGKMKGKWLSLEKSIHKNEELFKLYKKYQKELGMRKLYDFEDMIMETLRVLENKPNLLLELQETYQYVLADEHQDTNSAQNKILELISSFHSNPNLFVVGDEKQAIFRFQGASLENFLYFRKKYPKAEVIFLSKNYRSGQKILDASMSVINKDNDKAASAYRKPLLAHNKWRTDIKFYRFEKESSEYAFIAEDIKEKIKKGIRPSEIAVIYRENRDSTLTSEALKRLGVPYRVESNQNLLEDEFTWRILTLLRAVNNLSDDRLLAEALYLDIWNIPTFYVHQIIAQSNKAKKKIFEIISSRHHLKNFTDESSEIKRVSDNLERWGKLARNKHFLESLQAIVFESGILNMILEKGRHELEKFESFFEEARRASSSKINYKLTDFIGYIELLTEHKISIKSLDSSGQSAPGANSSVRLMTAHRSKGQEFEVVYIIGVNEGHWGNKRDRQLFKLPLYRMSVDDSNRDERKLFYVALTRAKKECILTSHSISNEGKNILPSQFISEIDKQYLSVEKTAAIEGAFKTISNFGVTQRQELPIRDKEYLLELFEEKGLSVSALNNYLECPAKYLFLNLLRMPQTPTKFQHYGNAVHESLGGLFLLIEREKKYSRAVLLENFKRHLEDKHLSALDFEELLSKGKKSLSIFYDANISAWKSGKAYSEMNIAGVFIKDEQTGNNILLRGRLDRVDVLENGDVVVTDFKTSRPKTRREIMGETKSSDGNLMRQLIFYKILLDSYENGRFKMTRGVIDFTEMDERGKHHAESFVIGENDVENLKEEIKRIYREINSLEFMNNGCKKTTCEYCRMLSLLPLNKPDSYSSKKDSTMLRISK